MIFRFYYGNNTMIIPSDMGESYVYAYLDPRKDPPEIFYVGKGKGYRYKNIFMNQI